MSSIVGGPMGDMSFWSPLRSKEEWAAACQAGAKAWHGMTGLVGDLCTKGGQENIEKGGNPSENLLESLVRYVLCQSGKGTQVNLKHEAYETPNTSQVAIPGASTGTSATKVSTER